MDNILEFESSNDNISELKRLRAENQTLLEDNALLFYCIDVMDKANKELTKRNK